jgi:hypothetical protein
VDEKQAEAKRSKDMLAVAKAQLDKHQQAASDDLGPVR